MNHNPVSSPVRAAFFYSTCILTVITLSTTLAGRSEILEMFLLQGGSFLVPSLVFALRFDRQPLRHIFRLRRLSLNKIGKSLVLGLLAWALALVLGILSSMLVEVSGGKSPNFYAWVETIPYWQALILIALIPAVCEEIAFRGYLQWNLRRLGERRAVILTALLFGLMHLSLIRIVPLALLGLIFSAAVVRSGSLASSMLIHFTNNAVSLSLSVLFRQHPAWDIESIAPSVTSVSLLLLALALLAPLTWRLLRSLGAGIPMAPAPADEEGYGEVKHESMLAILLPLLPALTLFIWAAANEISAVFPNR